MSTDIELYPRDQTDFSHHGYALDDISNDIVTWQLNAKFTLTFDYPMFSEHAGDLVAENIVRVPVPGGKAAFRIAQVIKSMGHLSITAYHVFWDLNDDFIADTNIVDKDGQGALDQIMRAANYPTGFKVLSTIGNVTNARLVRMSIINALLGTDDNTFLNRWGGEFDWQDFSFSVNPRLGEDRGVHFEYAHNLTGYEATKDSSGIITRLLPEGYNGLLLPELYVDSPKLGNYRKPKIGTKTYQDIKAIDETQATGDQKGAVPVQEAYELLRAAATKEFSESHIDEAKWTYKLNVALLENTEEYKDLSITTTVLPGDTVTITHKLDGIDVRARLTGYTWQPSNHSYLTQTYDSTSRPDVAYSNLSSRVNEIKSQIELVDKVVIAKAANGMNSTGWGDQSPVDLNIAGKTGDVYYQTTAKGTTMWLFHDGQWNAETGDAFGTEVQKKVDTAIADVAAAKQAANNAVSKGDVLSQINLEANRTLIQSGKLVLDAPTVVFTGNAFIPSAAIASLSADKITTGTLNAANLNVINLNASAIVTGTISGANLAINLNTGMVEFQKGRIHSTDNNIDINIDQKYISVTDSNNSVLLKGGSMTFTQPYAFDTDQTPYLTIDNVGSSQTLGRGAEIVGRDVLTVSVSGENNSFLSGAALFEKKFSGISVSKNYDTVVGGANRGVTIIGGSSYSIGLGMDSVPSIMVGYNKGGLTGGTRINIEAEYVHIPSAWSKTTSSSPNAFVASDGALVRSTSASKYKVNIERTRSTDLAERLLTVPNAHWLDKAAIERYASGEQKELPQTNFGLIAEDLEAAGLEDLVVRGPDGELEGIQYDRIAAALLPLLAQMKTEIDELKATA